MIRRIVLGATLLSLTGCGFHPLYAPTSSTPAQNCLQEVRVATIANRSGQQLRNYLLDTLTPEGTCPHPKYTLKVSLNETKRYLGFRKDATPRRGELTLHAHIDLINISSQEAILSASSRTIAGYSIGAQADFASYSSIVAEKSARERALKAISEDIKLKLAQFLTARETEATPKDLNEN